MGRANGAWVFRLTYPLAFLGAHLAFMPLLLLLLPRRVERLAPEDATSVLSLLLVTGAVTASIAHVVAGHWSDKWIVRHGSRRLPVALGSLLLCLSYGALASTGSIAGLALSLIAFQVALNIMFAPLGALLADYVHDREKGVMAAWLALALPISIMVSAPIASLFPADNVAAFAFIVVLVGCCVLPLLFFWPTSDLAASSVSLAGASQTDRLPTSDFRRAWIARLLVQCGVAFILFYLYVYLRQIPQSVLAYPPSSALAMLVTAGGLAGAAAALLLGSLSDRLKQRRWPVAFSAVASSAGLVLLALMPSWPLIVAGYAIFSAGLAAFLALDSALIAQMLGANPARGRWLGIMNLTNTLPAIVTPMLTLLALQVASDNAIIILLGLAATGNLVAATLILGIRSLR